MFTKLFAESGLSLDRLRALLEVGSAGSIVKAADADPVRQSQYSRQIKELEDFFRTRLIERVGKGTRLTASGRELARISRFFMLGLSNFQRGCLAEEQSFRVGASATFVSRFLIPAITGPRSGKKVNYVTEVASDEDIERRLHDLTLDFGVVERAALSRPLQLTKLGEWALKLWLPKAMGFTQARALKAFEAGDLPLALAAGELRSVGVSVADDYEAALTCDSFLEAKAALESGKMAVVLPEFLAEREKSLLSFPIPKFEKAVLRYSLAWNPRLLRLNPHAVRRRDWLCEVLTRIIRNGGAAQG